MNGDERLAQVLAALEGVGIRCLVMGGHAVRYYGVSRMTNDFDLTVAPDCWDDLALRMVRLKWLQSQDPREMASWRVSTFRRFQIGVLPSGREELLELWKENHLLAPFEELHARRESGAYGGRNIDFLSLPDLIRSKETERETDWLDIQFLEEFHDMRLAAKVRSGQIPLAVGLSQLRSRRGLETHLLADNLRQTDAVTEAIHRTLNPITAALLLPAVPAAQFPAVHVEAAIVQRLRTLAVGSPMHFALVEAMRRQYSARRCLQTKPTSRRFGTTGKLCSEKPPLNLIQVTISEKRSCYGSNSRTGIRDTSCSPITTGTSSAAP